MASIVSRRTGSECHRDCMATGGKCLGRERAKSSSQYRLRTAIMLEENDSDTKEMDSRAKINEVEWVNV